MHIIVGLGNPGEEYESTRHNAGRIFIEPFRKENDFPEWREEGKLKALVSEGKIGKEKVLLLTPNNFMNNSGKSLTTLVKSKKQAGQTIVIYDDLDLPVGTFKIAFNRGSGGHKGVESVARLIKTKEFLRIRVGICPTTPTGKLRKPKGEKAVIDFIMKKFTPDEEKKLKKAKKQVAEALETIITQGPAKAMNAFN